MPKTISTALQADIRKGLTTLNLAVTIRRRDGRIYRITNHDADVTLDSHVFRHDVPFSLPSIDSGAQLAIDNTQLVLFCDDVTFIKEEFESGLFDHAECEISLFDWENPTHGIMSLRKGWFGEITRNEHHVVKVTVTGLLKILDFEVGRVYQPSCDADLGDKRCKIAINLGQAYSVRNPYNLGDWVYRYDTSGMTAIPLVNASFDADGDRSTIQAITGWTRSPGASLSVSTSAPDGTLVAATTRALYGNTDVTSPLGTEHYVYQTITTTAAGMVNADIDAGKLAVGLFALVGQPVYLLDPVRIVLEQLDAAGEVIDTLDTRYQFLDVEEAWRERAVAGPVLAGCRSFRVTLYMRKEDGTRVNAAIDDVRFYFWDHTVATPYGGSIHKLQRVVSYSASEAYLLPNNSFEPVVANALNPTIGGWTVTPGSWWRTVASDGSLLPNDGSRFLQAGNDGTGTQRTDTISAIFNLITGTTSPKLDSARVALGQYFFRFQGYVGFGDTGCTATLTINQLNAGNTVVASDVILSSYNPGTVTWTLNTEEIAVAATATKIQIVLEALSASGTGNNRVAMDGISFWFYDVGKPKSTDPSGAFGDNATVWDSTPGSYTFDGNMVWFAADALWQTDVVASVIDRKAFTGTMITGAAGTYETGYIRWITGANANQVNLVRQWTEGTKKLKLYFRTPYPIQIGDRYVYVRSCQRRFLEDCKGTFFNAVNFRGFPYLPGRLTDAG